MFEIGDAVKSELRADGPIVEGRIVGLHPGGQFVKIEYTKRDGKLAFGMFEASGVAKVDAVPLA